MTDEPIDRRPGTLLRDYAAFFRREGLAHPRLAELDALADALDAITRADVAFLRGFSHEGAILRSTDYEDQRDMGRLAAKLAALLPPEGT